MRSSSGASYLLRAVDYSQPNRLNCVGENTALSPHGHSVLGGSFRITLALTIGRVIICEL